MDMTVTRLRAATWLADMQRAVEEIGMPFTAPLHNENEAENGVSFEWWWGNKKLTVHINGNEATYIRLWGGSKGPMYDGNCEHLDTHRLLWQWLMSEGT